MGKVRDWNFYANVIDGALFSFALSLVSQQTVLPLFVKKIGGGNIALGLIPVLWTLGFNVPQIAVARWAQSHPRKKGLLLKTALAQRLPWLLLAFVSFVVFERVGTEVALILFFAVYALAAIAGSVNFPVWFDLIATLTPVHSRGRLFAARSILGSLLGIAGGGVATLILALLAYPSSFALLFLLTFLAMMVSYLFLVSLREQQDAWQQGSLPELGLPSALMQILRGHHNFRNFLIADALLMSSTMANAFYTVNAFKRFSLPDEYAGVFTVAMMASMIAGSLLFGYLADRVGHKINLMISGLATAMACVVALTAPVVELYMLVFVGLSWSLGVAMISRFTIVAELCSEQQRPTYIALANLITSPFVLFGIVAGVMADLMGYASVFAAAGVLALASAGWYWHYVREPRQSVVPGSA